MAASISTLPAPPATFLCPTPAPTQFQTLTQTEQWLYSTLKSPKTLPQLQVLHAQALKTGFLARSDRLTRQLLLCCSLSSSASAAHYALRLLLSLPHPPDDPFPYNALISALATAGAYSDALLVYAFMRARSVTPDPYTLPPSLRSAATLQSIFTGLDAHALAVKAGLDADVFVCTALVDFYCSCGLPGRSRRIFDRTHDRDVICWNTMVAGHVKCGEFDAAQALFDRMSERNLSSWNTMVDMHGKIGDIRTARRLFDEMPDRDLISWNTIISGYTKVGDSDAARELFDRMPKRNVVSWNVMITCYVHNRLFSDALDLFRMMQASDVRPNEVTAVAVLPACAHLGALDLGQWIHSYIRKHKIKMDMYVTTALVDMYGRCGAMEDAWRIFDLAVKRDAFLCSTMIEVLAMHGRADEAFEVFEYMRSVGIRPNDVTFVGLLKACSHVGLVEIGLKYFEMMKRVFGLMPKVEHFGCMVDLLGRAAFLEEAHELILSMSMAPPPVVWASLLSSCRIHGDVKLAEKVALRLIELEPQSCGNYVLLSNIYSKANRWEDAAKVRNLMKVKGVVKKPGCSSIEVGNGVYEFLAGDRDHPRCGEIYEMLYQMADQLKSEGYVPCTSSALHDLDRNGREQAIIHHSEKLALAFGLISTEKGTAIRIVKNLRVCDDCHVFMKLASKFYNRQVIVRDRHRFHHFSDGSCSCSDYW